MLKTACQKVANILLKPFREHFLFLIAFFFLATSPYILKQILLYNNYYLNSAALF